MKPIIKKGKVAVFVPQGFLDSVNTAKVITMQDMQPLIANKFNMIIVSFKKVIHFNVNGMKMLADILKKINKEAGSTIGFCDYTELQYRAFLKIYEIELPFCLFETLETALIYAGAKEVKDNESILIYNEDSTQRSMQAIEFFDRGYNPVVTQTAEEFHKRYQKDKDAFVHATMLTYIGLSSNKIAVRTKKSCVIYYLRGFLDGEITEKFDIIYHQHCLKVGFRVFMLDAMRVSSVNIHATNFISKLATSGAEYGALFGIVGLDLNKISKKFINELEDAGILFFETESEFFASEEVTNTIREVSGGPKKDKGKLTKDLVAKLPVQINATIETITMMTNGEVDKKDVQIKPFNAEFDEDMVASSIAFYGELEGLITIVMSAKMAKKVCKLLIGEETDDKDVLRDTLGELANIIAGKTKSLLQRQDVDIMITLPRNYSSIDEVKAALSGTQGVRVDFDFGNTPFVFYLST